MYKYFPCRHLLLHHSKRVLTAAHLHQLAYLLAQVSPSIFRAQSYDLNSPIQVLHPAGNVAEHLVAAGLARVVDWHAGMLASNGGMERLRQAEKVAKERRLCLYASLPTASATAKANGTTTNGQTRAFDAIVVRVWSGDQVSVVEKDTGKERRLQLSSTRGPKYIYFHIFLSNMC